MTHLYEVQHALSEVGVPYQLYNVHDQLRPASSLIGAALRTALVEALETAAVDAHATLETLRVRLGLSDRDRAWSAILNATQGLRETTWGALALRLDSARPLARGGVILSTYHSAKGSEFDHVFVLNEGLRALPANEYADATRALYVALTRARESVTLLRREEDCHPTLVNRTYQTALQSMGVQTFDTPTTAPLPTHIRYQLDADPSDLYVSAPELLNGAGREAVQHYARQWDLLTLDGLQVRSAQGVVAKLSRGGKLNQRLGRVSRHSTIRTLGATVVRCERDDEWYAIARYDGLETHHHLVLPTFEVEEPLRPS